MLNFVLQTLRMVLLTTGLLLLPLTSSAYDNNSFIESLGDVPLMKELSIVEDSETLLDLPDGKIVEIFATTSLAEENISEFYREALPTLGWMPDKKDSYIRDKEMLQLDFFNGDDNSNTIRFTISPYRK